MNKSKLYDDIHTAVIDAGLKTHEVLTPDPELAKFVEQNKLSSHSQILDVGCGCGRNAVFLAKRGFTVTATDISVSAIKLTQRLAKESGVVIRTLVVDPCKAGALPREKFQAVIDARCLHNIITTHERRTFLSNLFESLVPGGWYFGANIGGLDEKSAKKKIVPDENVVEKIHGTLCQPLGLRTMKGPKTYLIRVGPLAAMWPASYRKELEQAGFLDIQINCSKGPKPLAGCLLATARKGSSQRT